MSSLDKLTVRGRGKRLVAHAEKIQADFVCLRADDRRIDEFWLEIYLDREQVAEILRRMDEAFEAELAEE